MHFIHSKQRFEPHAKSLRFLATDTMGAAETIRVTTTTCAMDTMCAHLISLQVHDALLHHMELNRCRPCWWLVRSFTESFIKVHVTNYRLLGLVFSYIPSVLYTLL